MGGTPRIKRKQASECLGGRRKEKEKYLFIVARVLRMRYKA